MASSARTPSRTIRLSSASTTRIDCSKAIGQL
jgi:hypothetical protein